MEIWQDQRLWPTCPEIWPDYEICVAGNFDRMNDCNPLSRIFDWPKGCNRNLLSRKFDRIKGRNPLRQRFDRIKGCNPIGQIFDWIKGCNPLSWKFDRIKGHNLLSCKFYWIKGRNPLRRKFWYRFWPTPYLTYIVYGCNIHDFHIWAWVSKQICYP